MDEGSGGQGGLSLLAPVQLLALNLGIDFHFAL